jgi:hypothetical protein
MRKIIGLARTIDFNGTHCRVRLCDKDGLPNGAVLTSVKYLSGEPPMSVSLPKLSDHELDTMARQNLLYNSHNPIVIE